MEEKKDLFEELETKRLILRKIVDSDAEMLYKNIYNNFEYYKFYYQIKSLLNSLIAIQDCIY